MSAEQLDPTDNVDPTQPTIDYTDPGTEQDNPRTEAAREMANYILDAWREAQI